MSYIGSPTVPRDERFLFLQASRSEDSCDEEYPETPRTDSDIDLWESAVLPLPDSSETIENYNEILDDLEELGLDEKLSNKLLDFKDWLTAREENFNIAVNLGKRLVDHNETLQDKLNKAKNQSSVMNRTLVSKAKQMETRYQELEDSKRRIESELEEVAVELEVNKRLLESKSRLALELEEKLWDYIEKLEQSEENKKSQGYHKNRKKNKRLAEDIEKKKSELEEMRTKIAEMKKENSSLKNQLALSKRPETPDKRKRQPRPRSYQTRSLRRYLTSASLFRNEEAPDHAPDDDEEGEEVDDAGAWLRKQENIKFQEKLQSQLRKKTNELRKRKREIKNNLIEVTRENERLQELNYSLVQKHKQHLLQHHEDEALIRESKDAIFKLKRMLVQRRFARQDAIGELPPLEVSLSASGEQTKGPTSLGNGDLYNLAEELASKFTKREMDNETADMSSQIQVLVSDFLKEKQIELNQAVSGCEALPCLILFGVFSFKEPVTLVEELNEWYPLKGKPQGNFEIFQLWMKYMNLTNNDRLNLLENGEFQEKPSLVITQEGSETPNADDAFSAEEDDISSLFLSSSTASSILEELDLASTPHSQPNQLSFF